MPPSPPDNHLPPESLWCPCPLLPSQLRPDTCPHWRCPHAALTTFPPSQGTIPLGSETGLILQAYCNLAPFLRQVTFDISQGSQRTLPATHRKSMGASEPGHRRRMRRHPQFTPTSRVTCDSTAKLLRQAGPSGPRPPMGGPRPPVGAPHTRLRHLGLGLVPAAH